MFKQSKLSSVTIFFVLFIVMSMTSALFAKSAKKWRILDIKAKVYSNDDSIKLEGS